jgi:hypothetical protein
MIGRERSGRQLIALLSVLAIAPLACDPVQDDAIAALGGEVGGVYPGPFHRPGQPCLLCHDGALGDPAEFSVAGTVFMHPTGTAPVNRATVELQDADGKGFEVVTNAAGNFFISPRHYAPRYPLEVKVHFENEVTTMHSTIGREGACAGCHFDPAGPDSPGHVYVRLDDGGVPP